MAPFDRGSVVHGRYEIVRRIARGGGGTVWAAYDRSLDRDVALKQVEIPDELPESERAGAKQRVLREAKAAARLGHPGVVTVYDVLDGVDRVHLVMELVDAPTLGQIVGRDGPLAEEDVARIGLALLDALGAAHAQGIIHRDVKPSNVFVHDAGHARLADFGIASVAGETSLTLTGTALGSPDYIAPEQAQGAPPAPAADLWALGATLYHAVEGVAPFRRSGLIPTLQAVVNEPHRALQRADRLRDLLDGLLTKDPQQRPDATEARRRLEAVALDPSPPHDTAELDATPTAGLAGAPPAAERSDSPATHGGAASGSAPPDHDLAPNHHLAPNDRGTRQAPADEVGSGAGRRRPALVAVAVLAVLAIGGLAVLLAGDDDPGAEVAEAPAGDEAATGAEDETTGAGQNGARDDSVDDAAQPETAPEDDADGPEADAGPAGGTPVDEADAVPDDWEVHEGATYQVAVPAGWEERAAGGNRTDYVEPASGSYLRVDHTDDPASDPLADWEAAAADFAQRHEGYEQVRLERVDYRDYDAAIWEYRYREGGADLRAVNLNILDGEHAYALNVQSSEADWHEVADHLPHITAGFQPQR